MDDTCPMPLKTHIQPIESLETLAEEALVSPGKQVGVMDNPGVELHYWPYKN